MTELVIVKLATLATVFVCKGFETVEILRNKTVDQLKKHIASVAVPIMSACINGYLYVRHRTINSFQLSKSCNIKHIYLIDRESGIHVKAVSSQHGAVLDSDAIGAMFSAIQSFVQDAFLSEKSSRLTNFRVGDHSILAAHGPKLMLACVVVGEVPQALKADLDYTLKVIQTQFTASLSGIRSLEDTQGVADIMETLMRAKC